MDPRYPPGSQFWQHFEHFAATYRCLKSKVLDEGGLTNISTVHAGARLNGNAQFVNHHLELEVSSHQQDTKSASHLSNTPWNIACEYGTVDISRGRHCILNGISAPNGDSFLCLDSTPAMNEVHQCKLLKSTSITGADYLAERAKSASANDFFILYTTQENVNVNLPNLSAIVDGSNWKDYFGPFAGRAFIFANEGVLNINNCSRTDLIRMPNIGEGKADTILKKRSKRKFDDVEDARSRTTGIGMNTLKQFRYC